MEMNPFLLTDWYKIGHPFQYPANTVTVYTNGTARKSRLNGIDKMVVFGLQGVCQQYLIDYFNRNFFNRSKEIVLAEYKRRVRTSLGFDLPSYQHIEDIHDLGYLPVEIKALPEGSRVDMRVPFMTIRNTLPKFYWVTNFLETLLSTTTWQAMTSATIAYDYKQILTKYAKETGVPAEFVQWQGHDFSMRGMSSIDTAATSGAGHLLSFTGTDTIPAIDYLEQYYGANVETELVGGSIPATEHAVMCAGTGVEGEFNTFKRLITQTYPNGNVAIVSDTFNLWDVIRVGGFMDQLKTEIMARDGKVVVRPDSGDPVDIICGVNSNPKTSDKVMEYEDCSLYYKNDVSIYEHKGVVELLWDVFGGTVNEKGYKVLDSHVGVIYGDSITRERAVQISERLKAKGFASQVVLGIGSYTYQFNTRDSLGLAFKATYIEVTEWSDSTHPTQDNHQKVKRGIEIFKDPITDDGTKRSARGLLMVEEHMKPANNDFHSGRMVHDKYVLVDRVTEEDEKKGALKTIFLNGKMVNVTTLAKIRARLNTF